jgi:alkylated DNA repair protein (DNA oxidative demethylase)
MHDGRQPLNLDGFTYLPGFISLAEADELVHYFGAIHPIWENRHEGADHVRKGQGNRRLTRPVYWLGAWQFACLGYYSEPAHRTDRCLRAEPYPPVMQRILARLKPHVVGHLGPDEAYADTSSALINYYGSELLGQPVDRARLRPHRDSEPGPVLMLSIGQPARFEFVDDKGEVALGVWLRHRSVCILSGPEFKERLYHQVSQVRHGQTPAMHTTLPDFQLRRISVSFRHVPAPYIHEWPDLSVEARDKVRPYVDALAKHAPTFRFESASEPEGAD